MRHGEELERHVLCSIEHERKINPNLRCAAVSHYEQRTGDYAVDEQQVAGGTGFVVDECTTLARIAEVVHEMACDKGWWQNAESTCIPEKIALMHSELSEALEEYRNWGIGEPLYNSDFDDACKPEGLAVEFADCIIRILDTCQAFDLPILEALSKKIAYNAERPVRHGNKLA